MLDPDHIFGDPKYRKEQLLFEGAWRFQLIAPLLGEQLDSAAKARIRKLLLTQTHLHPYRGEMRLSARTLRRWCRTYRELRLQGLCRQVRCDRGRSRSLPEEAFEAAKALFQEDPHRSVPVLIGLLATADPRWAKIRRTTLGRHLRAAGLFRNAIPPMAYRKFEAKAGNLRWQGDVLHGPKVLVNGEPVTAKVVSWLDDYSRFVVHLEAFDNERLPVLEHTLTRAIMKYGKPESVLVDNGKIYSSTGFSLACSQLGIRKIHCKPYHPEGKGKQERFFRTLREQLLNEIENVDPLPLEQFNRLLEAWLSKYHATVHSQTEATPQERYANTETFQVSREKLEEAFLQWAKRKVTSQAFILLARQEYYVDPSLVGRELLVRYDPFDLSRIYLWRDGAKLCCATPEKLLQPTLERRVKNSEKEHSSAALRYLKAIEDAHQRQLERELNILRLEDDSDE